MVQRAFSEGGHRLRGVELFTAGKHRGKTYTPRHLDEMVDAFRRYSADHTPDGKPQTPLLEVPGVLGHEEDQALLDDTSLPAAAWLKRVWRKGKSLYGDFEDVPASVARLIKGKRYKHLSAEIYDEHPDGLPTAGKKAHMLRRVAFLGGEIPQIKTLADIPVPEAMGEGNGGGWERYSEAASTRVATRLVPARSARGDGQRTKAGTVWLFSEVRTMDRDAILKKLGDLGMDTTALGDAVPTEALSEILRCMTEDKGGEDKPADEHGDDDEATEVPSGSDADEDGDGDAEQHADDEDDADDSEDEEVEENGELTIRHEDDDEDGDEDEDDAEEHAEDDSDDAGDEPERPEDEDDHEAMAEYYEKCAERHRKMCAKPMSEGETSEATRTKPTPGQGTGNNNQPVAPAVKQGANMLSEKQTRSIIKRLEKRVENTEKRAAKVEKFTERQLRAAKEKMVRDTVDNLVAAGKVLPSEVDGGLVDVLLSLSTAKTLKFSEKGKTVTRSPLDQALAVLKNRAKLHAFGERTRTQGGKGADAEDAEIEKVKEHFEAFSEQFERGGMTKERLVEGFKANRKVNKNVTADEFLNTR